MMTIEEFIESGRVATLPELEDDLDPLRLEDMLLEAQVLDTRFDALNQSAAILIDLRMALQLRETNTGVIVGLNVQHLEWAAGPRPVGPTAWTIASSSAGYDQHAQVLSLAMWPSPGARLNLRAGSIRFVVGDVPELDETPPDLLANEPALGRGGWQSWSSTFEAKAASIL